MIGLPADFSHFVPQSKVQLGMHCALCRGPRSAWWLLPRIAQYRPHDGSQLNVMMSGPWAGAQGQEEETPVSSCDGLKVFWQPGVFTAAYAFVRLVTFLCFEWLTRLRKCTLLSKMEVWWSLSFLLCLRTASAGWGGVGVPQVFLLGYNKGLRPGQSCFAVCLLEKDLFPLLQMLSHHQALLFGIPCSLSLTSSHWWEIVWGRSRRKLETLHISLPEFILTFGSKGDSGELISSTLGILTFLFFICKLTVSPISLSTAQPDSCS